MQQADCARRTEAYRGSLYRAAWMQLYSETAAADTADEAACRGLCKRLQCGKAELLSAGRSGNTGAIPTARHCWKPGSLSMPICRLGSSFPRAWRPEHEISRRQNSAQRCAAGAGGQNRFVKTCRNYLLFSQQTCVFLKLTAQGYSAYNA